MVSTLLSVICGTTSACAENTSGSCHWMIVWRNYLRVRGEYHDTHTHLQHGKELPPRARRIPVIQPRQFPPRGTTSACAENTHPRHIIPLSKRNYLRVRGEYLYCLSPRAGSLELPPRARRIRLSPLPPDPRVGTTSACAENTFHKPGGEVAGGNYLRVRGEYDIRRSCQTVTTELPPRARRIHGAVVSGPCGGGTTSACAENTGGWSKPAMRFRNYLRVRGEYGQLGGMAGANLELPPRARRIHLTSRFNRHFRGTTSACAENTSLL